jgi:hypothetical protein
MAAVRRQPFIKPSAGSLPSETVQNIPVGTAFMQDGN